MSVRSILAGLATVAVAASATTMIAVAPASADPATTPDANDVVGVGSDTTENVLDFLADGTNGIPGYNFGKTAADPLLASFDTVGSPTITLRTTSSGPITRPVGSGAGKALLYGATNNPDVTFARSSSALSTTEVSAGLQAFPFALDTLKMAVDGAGSHAPASLTGQQVLDIYKGNITDWSAVGGTAGTIKPYVPQSNSGTYSFFNAQLIALNGGTAFTYGADVDNTMHENTDDVLKADPNAVAPFSVGKAALLFPTTVHLLDGFAPQRALYNVIRGVDLGNSVLQGIFGTSGFICSNAAQPLIEAAGFHQLATPAHGGACGGATQSPTSNFTLNQPVNTGTTVTVSSKAARAATMVATVSASSPADGTVAFYEGTTLLQSGVPLVSGQATYTKTGTTPGTHSYTAMFTPTAGSVFNPSQGAGSGYVKTSSKITESFPAKVKQGVHAKGTITVLLKGITNKAKGKVKVFAGHKLLVKKGLSHGKVTLKLPKLKKGKNHLKIVWAGDTHAFGKTKKFTIKQL
jgi:ABC-type phosphate transport system substrate-binding protein